MKIGADDPGLGEAMAGLYPDAERLALVDAAEATGGFLGRWTARLVIAAAASLVGAAIIGGVAVFVEVVGRFF